MPNHTRPEDPPRESSDRHFHHAVHAATAIAYARAAWQPPEYAYVILASELRSRGIDPEPDAIHAGAALISRGVPPPILRA